MSAAAIVVGASPLQTNDQSTVTYIGTLTVTGTEYPVGGIALDSALQAALLPRSNQAPLYVYLFSTLGTGYVYTRIPGSGKMMILQVPPSGSLTTATPMQQLTSAANSLSGVNADVISFEARYKRNA